MKINAKLFALSTVAVSAVSAAKAPSSNLRQLQDGIDPSIIPAGVCTACSLCDGLGTLCQPSVIKPLICTDSFCDLLGDQGTALCNACDTCDANPTLCTDENLDNIADMACDLLCGDDGGDGGDGGTPDACFSEVATVQVHGMSTATTMKDLQLGDRVLTAEGKYEAVYAFGHHHPTKSANFFQLHSNNADKPLEVTADHLVFLQDKSSPVPAKDVQVGDVLRTDAGVGSSVTKVSTVERKGIYAPFTTGGTLLVDGVAASSYIHLNGKQTVVSDHDLSHLVLSPYRLLCDGVSAAFCDTQYYNEDGMPHLVHYGLQLLHWVLNSGLVTQTVGLSAIFVLAGACQLLENLFGASLAPLMVFLGVAAFVANRNSNKSKAKVL